MDEFSALIETVSNVIHHPILNVGDKSITLYGIIGLFTLFALVVAGERLFRRLVIRRVLARMGLDSSMRFGIEKITGYLLVTFGFYLALQAVGVDLSSLAMLAGAVGVGLGFGLQNIFSNFVSGLIILVERPISIGDRVDVNGVAGQVTKISLRSTVVVTNDNIAIIVPNSKFISETVTNWSYGDRKVRIRLSFGVAYGTDTDRLKEVALGVARANSAILADPEPVLYFISFGESAMDFELAVWTATMSERPRRLRSDLNYALEKALREAGIEIPFPQRDLHIRSGSPHLGK